MLDRICEELAAGQSLVAVCSAAGMPATGTVLRWLDEDEVFRDMYARAREAQADKMADEIVEIADRPDLKPEDKRVRVDARKWVASKLKPKKYGDKVEHSGVMTHRIQAIERTIVDPANPDG